jgi:hypothetical protein
MVSPRFLLEHPATVRAVGRRRSLLELGSTHTLWTLFRFNYFPIKGVS